MQQVEYLPIEKAIKLEESISFISNLTQPDDKYYVIGNSVEEKDRDVEKTELLQELLKINKRRQYLLKELLKI